MLAAVQARALMRVRAAAVVQALRGVAGLHTKEVMVVPVQHLLLLAHHTERRSLKSPHNLRNVHISLLA